MLDSRPLAKRLGCSYQTLIRVTGDMADGSRTVWSFQGYGFMVFLRYKAHDVKKCGHPQFYVINRYAAHTIGGEPGQVRARLRQKSPKQWLDHLKHIFKLAMGKILRGRKPGNDKHKASPQEEQEVAVKARPPPAANRGGLRRFKGLAVGIQAKFDALSAAPRTDLYGWALRRLSEWHSDASIVCALRHAVKVLPRGRYAPINACAWICAVAARHLDGDGLAPVQRWQEFRPKKAAANAATFKEGNAVDADAKRRHDEIANLSKEEYDRIFSPWLYGKFYEQK